MHDRIDGTAGVGSATLTSLQLMADRPNAIPIRGMYGLWLTHYLTRNPHQVT